ncbi:MAG: hypothetical protein ABIH41_02715, partial [Nanoarchaeota archaeon]
MRFVAFLVVLCVLLPAAFALKASMVGDTDVAVDADGNHNARMDDDFGVPVSAAQTITYSVFIDNDDASTQSVQVRGSVPQYTSFVTDSLYLNDRHLFGSWPYTTLTTLGLVHGRDVDIAGGVASASVLYSFAGIGSDVPVLDVRLVKLSSVERYFVVLTPQAVYAFSDQLVLQAGFPWSPASIPGMDELTVMAVGNVDDDIWDEIIVGGKSATGDDQPSAFAVIQQTGTAGTTLSAPTLGAVHGIAVADMDDDGDDDFVVGHKNTITSYKVEGGVLTQMRQSNPGATPSISSNLAVGDV